MTRDFSALVTPSRLGPGVFRADVPDGWQQGRGAFGGLVIGNLVSAIVASDVADPAEGARPRTLRSLTAELCGPVPVGESTIRVECLRAGTGVTTLAARLEHEGEVLAHAVGVLGRRRAEGTDFCDVPRPTMPPWREVEPVPLRAPFAPTFAQFFEFRPLGALAFSGGADAVTSGWVRPLDPGPVRGVAYVAALVDAWWPAMLTRFTEPRPIGTIAFTLELLDDLAGLDAEAPLFHSARVIAARGGYMVELRELWGEDGRLVALNQQTIAIIK